MAIYLGLKDFRYGFKAMSALFQQQIEDIVKDTIYEIKDFSSLDMAESLSVHTVFITEKELLITAEALKQDRKVIENRIKEFEDEENPCPSIIWYHDDGIITITGYY